MKTNKTNKVSFTPGPWVMDIEKQTTGHWYYKIVTEEKPLGNYPLHICTLNKFKDETHLKNAALIAAAPELYEMLDKINAAFYTRTSRKEWLELMEQTKPLLQKTRGE